MLCPRCHTENREGRRFCAKCAAPLAVVCTSCGFTNDPGDEFCGGCAQSLRAGTPMPPKLQSPESYTPKHLAEKILTSKAALEGERKQVTVLFADLKGSMELLADRDPEEARKLLDPILEHMMEAVHRYEGTVNQVMGDGIMALFGAPLAHEDHAVRACYAALRMQESVKRYAEGVRREQGVTIRIRVGLNSGEVVVRAIGSDLRMDYTAVGQTTHLAARMEQLADPGAIVITPETLALAEGYVAVKALGPVPVRGLADPVEVYEVTGAGPARTRLQASARRGLTRFVGRDAELEQLRQTLELARTGQGQVVAVVGEPGVGKSRLYWEFTHSHGTQGWLIVESGSVSYGKATTYLPVIDLLKAYFQIGARDDSRKIREKVTGKVLALDRLQLEPYLPALLSLLDVPPEDPRWERLDPSQRRQKTLDGVKHLLFRESQVQPLLVLFEDLHWIDVETQAFLDSLIESLPTVRLLLLVNYRPEYTHTWGNKTYYSQLRITPLPLESAEDLLDALLGDHAALGPLRRLLIARTEGNPFFLEESVRTLAETNVLVGARGAYRVARPPETTQLPSTVQAVLAARVDRLSPEEKRLLQSAAVIGKDVPVGLLQAIADLPEPELRGSLTHLQAAEFLYETSLFPDLEYTFKHALTHEVVYRSLLQERRRALHARVVGAIEALHPDQLAEHVERLAHHALGGEVWAKAFTYCHDAGTKASTRSAYREALAWFEQSLAAFAHVPEDRAHLKRAIDIRLQARSSLVALGDLAPILEQLRHAERLAETLGDNRQRSLVAFALAHLFWLTGHHDQAIESGQRAFDLAINLEDLTPRILACIVVGEAHYSRGEYEEAIAWLGKNLELLRGDLHDHYFPPAYSGVATRRWLVHSLAELGSFSDAAALSEEAIEIAHARDHPFSLVNIQNGLGFLFACQGDFHRAIPVLERSLELSRTLNFQTFMVSLTVLLALIYAHTGRHAEALVLIERMQPDAPQRALQMGEAYLLAGRATEASECATAALALARERKERGHEAWALRLLGEIASRRDPPEHADGHYRDALALAEELGMRPLVAHCHLGLGKLYRRTGQQERAREYLTTATTMYREMDMRFWLEQAEQELRELG